MKIFRYDSIDAQDVVAEGASGTTVRWLISKEMGAGNFAMRVFEVQAGGFTPLHTHPWEHEVFILEGQGQLFDGKEASRFKADDVVFVPPNEPHQFKNDSQKLLRFICLIPYTENQP